MDAAEDVYAQHLDTARRALQRNSIDVALDALRHALALEPMRPEAYNLLGVAYDKMHDHRTAMKFYRVSRDFDPSYQPARNNLERSETQTGPFDLDDPAPK